MARAGRAERLVAVLKHLDFQYRREAIRGSLEVEEHFVATSPPHEANFVWIHFIQEERYGPSSAEVAGADFGVHEPNGWSLRDENHAAGSCNLGTADLCPRPGMLENFNGGVAGDSMESKVYHTATHRHHWTPDGGACAYVPNLFPLYAIFWGM